MTIAPRPTTPPLSTLTHKRHPSMNPPPSPSLSSSPSQLSTSLTATTMTTLRLVFQCEPPLPAHRKWRHSLPEQPTALHPALQLIPLHLETPCFPATSPPTTVTKNVATTPETIIQAKASTQTTNTILKNNMAAENKIRQWSIAQENDSRDNL